MKRSELHELHYITLIENVPSIIKHGILSNDRARQLEHKSVAMQEVQELRARVLVPGGHRLHEYANLYICARNPMLYKRRNRLADLCVLRIDPAVLELPGVVIADGNASGAYVRFAPAPAGLANVDRDLTFADDWTDVDQITYFRKKSAKRAEVLVPDRVDRRFLLGALVATEAVKAQFEELRLRLPVEVNAHLFFLTT